MSHSDLTGDETARLLPRGAGSSDDGGASLPSSRPSSPPRTKSSERSKGPQRFWKALRAVIGFLLSNWYKFAILGIVITLIVLVSIHGFSIFPAILEWFKKRSGWGGWGAYLGIYTAIVALFIPGVVFIMGAGFVFGFWRGLLAVWLGGSIGQALAFLLARYLLRDWVESFVNNKWKKWKYIDAALEKDGWKLVLIMRLSPIIPYNLLNIAMATTSIHFLAFALVSSVGILFECGIFVYLGTIADGITSIVEGGKGGEAQGDPVGAARVEYFYGDCGRGVCECDGAAGGAEGGRARRRGGIGWRGRRRRRGRGRERGRGCDVADAESGAESQRIVSMAAVWSELSRSV